MAACISVETTSAYLLRGGVKMSKIAILYCKRIKDVSCVACAKCFKAVDQRDGEFAKLEEAQIVAMTHCGD